MGVIYEWLIGLYAMFAILPFISFAVFWIVIHYITNEKKKATTLSMDITTFLLVASVSVMYDLLLTPGLSGFWIIVLFMLITAGLIGNAQNRKRGSIDAKRLIRAVWRLSFLVLSFFYIVFLLIGLIKYIFFS